MYLIKRHTETFDSLAFLIAILAVLLLSTAGRVADLAFSRSEAIAVSTIEGAAVGKIHDRVDPATMLGGRYAGFIAAGRI